jgi:NAD(P)-dependent dehydrogenase (short-subunit alcohol dehydrogenase family)
MIAIDYRGRVLLVTGGTRGIGLAIGVSFARAGARVYLTQRWGSADPESVSQSFRNVGAEPPVIADCDVADPAATRKLMARIADESGRLDAVVSNVAFGKVISDLPDLKKSSLDLSLAYSAWPVVELVTAARMALGAFPRYVVGISSDGPEVCHPGYDLAGVSKAVLETLCRYLALRLKPEGVRVNALRPWLVDTASFRATFGDAAARAIAEGAPGIYMRADAVGDACLALCSGLLDSLTGQVISVDEGWSLVGPISYLSGVGQAGSFPAESDCRPPIRYLTSTDPADGAPTHSGA